MLVEWGLKSDPAIAKYQGRPVPLIGDLAKTEIDRKALEMIVAGAQIGRPFLAPPGVPQDRVEALRRAFDATMKDPLFLEDTAKQKMDIDPVSGAELQKLAAEVVALPESVIKRARQLVDPRDIRE